MTTQTLPAYQIDARWRIVAANEDFCRTFKCTESGIIGRDVRDLLRDDWRLDFRSYVARALVGVGDLDVTLPMQSPCGEQAWYKHTLEPLQDNGRLAGYRATIQPQVVHGGDAPKRWWDYRIVPLQRLWNCEPDHLVAART